MTLGEVHAQHAPFVWRSLQRLGVHPADLDDALQDVFIVVHRRLSTFDETCKIQTWLFGICLRVASNRRRMAHHRHEVLTGDLPEVEAPNDADSALRQKQAALFLGRVLDRLDLDKRAVFVMFELEGMSGLEIAEIVGIPVATVQSRLLAARKIFQESLAKQTLIEGGRP
jgi:RNA polymerase sigma-70 factor (ECF subfamily)